MFGKEKEVNLLLSYGRVRKIEDITGVSLAAVYQVHRAFSIFSFVCCKFFL